MFLHKTVIIRPVITVFKTLKTFNCHTEHPLVPEHLLLTNSWTWSFIIKSYLGKNYGVQTLNKFLQYKARILFLTWHQDWVKKTTVVDTLCTTDDEKNLMCQKRNFKVSNNDFAFLKTLWLENHICNKMDKNGYDTVCIAKSLHPKI